MSESLIRPGSGVARLLFSGAKPSTGVSDALVEAVSFNFLSPQRPRWSKWRHFFCSLFTTSRETSHTREKIFKKAFKMLCLKQQEVLKVQSVYWRHHLDHVKSLSDRETHFVANWCQLESKLQKIKVYFSRAPWSDARDQEALGADFCGLWGSSQFLAAPKPRLSHQAWRPGPCRGWYARTLHSYSRHWFPWAWSDWSRIGSSAVEGASVSSALARGQHPREGKEMNKTINNFYYLSACNHLPMDIFFWIRIMTLSWLGS